MNDTEKQNLNNLFASIRHKAEEKRRIEAEREKKLNEIFKRPEEINPLKRLTGRK
jgi:hypothetical protein